MKNLKILLIPIFLVSIYFNILYTFRIKRIERIENINEQMTLKLFRLSEVMIYKVKILNGLIEKNDIEYKKIQSFKGNDLLLVQAFSEREQNLGGN